jgi:hypothetical protein
MNNQPKNHNPIQGRAPSQPEPVIPNPNPASAQPPQPEADEPVVYCYSRKNAIADGVQVEVSSLAKEAGFKFPVFVTQSVWQAYVRVPEGVSGQDETGRLWDLLSLLRYAIRRSPTEQIGYLEFRLFVRNADDQPAREVTLVAECDALDFDDPRPAMTISMPGED